MGCIRAQHGAIVRLQGGTTMKVNPYHTNSSEAPPSHRAVHHDHDDCFEGKKIERKHRESGTAGKPRCKECIKLG
jgi:hypothetical protein